MSEIKDAGITISGSLTDVWSIFKLILQVLGLTIENVFARLEKKLLDPALVAKLKKMFNVLSGVWDWITVLIKEGPAGLWRKIQEQLSGLKQMLISGIISWLSQNIIVKVTVKILSMLNPAELLMAVVNGVIAVYKAVQSFVKYLTQMLQILNTVLDSLVGLAKGDISTAAGQIKSAMAGAIPVMIGFLANQLGLSGIGKRIGELIKSARKQVEKAIDWLIDKALAAGKALLSTLGLGGKPDERTPEQKQQDLDKGVAEADALLKDKNLSPNEIKKKLPAIKSKYKMTSLELVTDSASETKEVDYIHGEINPKGDTGKAEKEKPGPVRQIDEFLDYLLQYVNDLDKKDPSNVRKKKAAAGALPLISDTIKMTSQLKEKPGESASSIVMKITGNLKALINLLGNKELRHANIAVAHYDINK